MKHALYSLLFASGLLLCAPSVVRADAPRSFGNEIPTAAQRNATAPARAAKAADATKSTATKTRKSSAMSRRSVLAVLGLEAGKDVTTPAQRQRQLRALQKQLHAKARTEARARRARCGQPLR